MLRVLWWSTNLGRSRAAARRHEGPLPSNVGVVAKRRQKSGGRTTPKGTRPGEHHRHRAQRRAIPSTSELLLGDAEWILREDPTVEEAEIWASGNQGAFVESGLPPIRPADPVAVLADLRRAGGPAAMLFAETMAIYGPFETRVRARELVSALADAGVEMPAWASTLGRVTPIRVVMVTDIWDDGCSFHLDCERDDGTVEGIGVSVDRIGGVLATDFVYGPTIAAVERLVAEDLHTAVVDVDAAAAAATVELALLERSACFEPDDDPSDPSVDLEALVSHRFGLLPEGGEALFASADIEETRDATIEAFLARPSAAILADAADIADTICTFAGYCDGQPLLWSPARVDTFLGGFIPAKVIADEAWYRNVPPVLREWLRFAAEATGLSEAGLDINLSRVDHSMGLMQEARHDPAARSPATAIAHEMIGEGVDLTDSAAVDGWIERYNERPLGERY